MLLDLKSDELEAALWSSVRLLKEKAALTRQVAANSRANGNDMLAERSDDQANLDEQHARAIRDLVEAMPTTSYQDAAVEPVVAHRHRAGK